MRVNHVVWSTCCFYCLLLRIFSGANTTDVVSDATEILTLVLSRILCKRMFENVCDYNLAVTIIYGLDICTRFNSCVKTLSTNCFLDSCPVQFQRRITRH